MSTEAAPFAHLDEQALRGAVPGGSVRSYAKSVVIVSEGDMTDSLYVVLSGRVKAFVSDENGREAVVNTIGVGDYFGELVLDGGPRSASIMTLEPCKLYVIPQADVAAFRSASAWTSSSRKSAIVWANAATSACGMRRTPASTKGSVRPRQ